MSHASDIKRLLDDGNYLEASRLADKHKVTDCRNFCQKVDTINEIANSIDNTIAAVSTLGNKITNFESELRNIKDTAFQMEEKEHAAQVQFKNIEDTCKIIEELVQNLKIPNHIQAVLLEGNLDDEDFIESMEETLNEFERILQYKPDPALLDMKCVRDQQEHAANIKSKFCERLYRHFTWYVDLSLTHEEGVQIGLYSLYLLARLSQYLSSQSSSNNFLVNIYEEVTVIVKKNFDSFMNQQLESIRELKVPKQSKCGVLTAVKSFEQFAGQVELLFESTGSRSVEVDRWYPELVTELFKTIDRVEHNRTPTEMIRLENYKYLHDVLSSIKVPCLKTKTKEAKTQYEGALNAYVTRYFGRPLERVNIFFDGVQTKVSQGVKEEEISFQLAFSKAELRKVLQTVTIKEVRKGLEEMYKRIEKHAYEPKSNLIEVIWHAMQTEFLSQYKAIQGMIERCYPASNLGLMFTIEDVLQVFSDIAQSH